MRQNNSAKRDFAKKGTGTKNKNKRDGGMFAILRFHLALLGCSFLPM
jgi:hypothetical protein